MHHGKPVEVQQAVSHTQKGHWKVKPPKTKQYKNSQQLYTPKKTMALASFAILGVLFLNIMDVL